MSRLDHELQFARVLCALWATQKGRNAAVIRKALGLAPEQLDELFERAHLLWSSAAHRNKRRSDFFGYKNAVIAKYPAVAEFPQARVRVTLEHIGDGFNGVYDPSNPADVPLLRFFVESPAGHDSDGQRVWGDVEDGSHCTRIPVGTAKAVQQKLAQLILEGVYPRAVRDESLKRVAEDLSWIGLEHAEITGFLGWTPRNTSAAA